MTKIVQVENLSKQFILNSARASKSMIRSYFNNLCGLNKPDSASKDSFWALKNINFDMNQGEVLGIIGKNGAGKSTLLKVLSRITSPTEGRATLNGRVGSLLEVGTGFHPELTGRENVFFNGTILGLSKKEIKSQFDKIVEFSGVEKFIDTPIKRYSSGMKMRLAFSVAAHLEPEILIIDEVLAVGDADFQEKCLGKMRDVSRAGRTVLFVSHNLNAVRQLCSRVLWLDKGILKEDSEDVHTVCSKYLLGDVNTLRGSYPIEKSEKFECEYFILHEFKLVNSQGIINSPILGSESIGVEIHLDIKKLSPLLNFGCAVIDEEGQHVLWTVTTDNEREKWPKLRLGENRLFVDIPPNLLNEGQYTIDFFASLHGQGWLSEVGNTNVNVALNICGGLSDSPYWRDKRPGVIAPVLDWRTL